MFQQISNLFLKEKYILMIRRQQTIGFFYRKLKIMNEYNELLFSPKKRNENFQFCIKMYMGSTRNGIEFCFNSQTVLILLLLLKTVCGIELLSFNKKLRCT